jgi:hypothetical protein
MVEVKGRHGAEYREGDVCGRPIQVTKPNLKVTSTMVSGTVPRSYFQRSIDAGKAMFEWSGMGARTTSGQSLLINPPEHVDPSSVMVVPPVEDNAIESSGEEEDSDSTNSSLSDTEELPEQIVDETLQDQLPRPIDEGTHNVFADESDQDSRENVGARPHGDASGISDDMGNVSASHVQEGRGLSLPQVLVPGRSGSFTPSNLNAPGRVRARDGSELFFSDQGEELTWDHAFDALTWQLTAVTESPFVIQSTPVQSRLCNTAVIALVNDRVERELDSVYGHDIWFAFNDAFRETWLTLIRDRAFKSAERNKAKYSMATWYQTVKVVDKRWNANEKKRWMQTHPARERGALIVEIPSAAQQHGGSTRSRNGGKEVRHPRYSSLGASPALAPRDTKQPGTEHPDDAANVSLPPAVSSIPSTEELEGATSQAPLGSKPLRKTPPVARPAGEKVQWPGHC